MDGLRSLSSLAVVLALGACASASPQAEVTGTVFYRERIMLVPPGKVTVTLADVSRADAPAEVLAQQVIEDVHAPPIAFRLAYDPARIVANHRYTVSARIEVDGKLRFISDTAYPVITGGAPSKLEILTIAVH